MFWQPHRPHMPSTRLSIRKAGARTGPSSVRVKARGMIWSCAIRVGRVGPMFWAHYSFLGLDPRGLKDDFCNDYGREMRHYTLANRAYCLRNPEKHAGYGANCWGLTASYSTVGYAAHAPFEEADWGVISPTAALSSIVYTPGESMQVMRYLYEDLNAQLWGPYGFYDAFSMEENWFPPHYLGNRPGPDCRDDREPPVRIAVESLHEPSRCAEWIEQAGIRAGCVRLRVRMIREM